MFNIFGMKNRNKQNDNDRTFTRQPKSVSEQLEELKGELLTMDRAMAKEAQRMDKLHKFHHNEKLKLQEEIQRLRQQLNKRQSSNTQSVHVDHNYATSDHSVILNEVIYNENENNNNNDTELPRNSSPIQFGARKSSLKKWNTQMDLSSISDDSSSSEYERPKQKPKKQSNYKMQASAIPVLHGRPNEDLDEWIFIIERFFRKNKIPEEEQVDVAVDYLKDNALVAYRELPGSENLTWEELKLHLIYNFQPINV